MACAALSLAGACSSDGGDVRPYEPVADGECFRLAVDGITTDGCTINIEPKDPAMTFVSMVIDRAYFDSFGSDAAYVADDAEWFEAEALSSGMSLPEYLSGVLMSGEQHNPMEGLADDTEYYLYAYGMSGEGELLSELEKVRFRTKKVEKRAVSFSIGLSNLTTTSVSVHVEADPKGAPFFFYYMPDDVYKAFGSDYAAARAYVSNMVGSYLADGYKVEDLVSGMVSYGSDDDEFFGLRPSTTYHAFAVGVNDRFQVDSEPVFETFRTADVKPSDVTFDVRIDSRSAGGIRGTIVPSNDTDKYFWDIQLRETCSLLDDGMLMTALVNNAGAMLQNYIQSGPSPVEIDHLAPGTDYTICIFGYDGAPTTGLTRFEVSTMPAGDPATLSLEFSASNISFDRATVNVRASVDDVPYVWNVVDARTFDMFVERSGSADAAVKLIYEEELDLFIEQMRDEYGSDIPEEQLGEWAAGELFSIGDAGATLRLKSDTEYVAWGVSVDLQTGKSAGKGMSGQPFRTKAQSYGDASVNIALGAYYDGDEIRRLGGPAYAKYAGKALLTYTISPSSSAATWYSTIFAGDLSDVSDASIISNLVTYGYDTYTADTPQEERKVSKDLSAGVWDIPFGETCSLTAIAKDAAGDYGHGVVVPFTLDRSGVSPAEEFFADTAPASRPAFRRTFSARAKGVRGSRMLRRPTAAGKAAAKVAAASAAGSGVRHRL